MKTLYNGEVYPIEGCADPCPLGDFMTAMKKVLYIGDDQNLKELCDKEPTQEEMDGNWKLEEEDPQRKFHEYAFKNAD